MTVGCVLFFGDDVVAGRVDESHRGLVGRLPTAASEAGGEIVACIARSASGRQWPPVSRTRSSCNLGVVGETRFAATCARHGVAYCETSVGLVGSPAWNTGLDGTTDRPGSGAYDELARVVGEDWLAWLGRRST